MVLDRNPANYFAEVEQIAFAPAHLVPGIEPSPDKMLQGNTDSPITLHSNSFYIRIILFVVLFVKIEIFYTHFVLFLCRLGT